MNWKQIRSHWALIILLALSLAAVSCGLLACGGGQDEATSTAAEATGTTKVTETTETTETAEAPAGDDQTTAPVSGEDTSGQDSSPTVASSGAPASYRIQTIWRDGGPEGAVTSQWDTEFVADPMAVHHKATGDVDMEIIFVGKTLWTKIMDTPWRQQEFAEGDTEALASMLSQTESPMEVDEQTSRDDSIQWLMGQTELKIAKGSLTPDGGETVNGIACKRYTVDSTYPYTVTYQAPMSGSATITEATQGTIWVADDGAFVVRAQVTQTTTTKVEGGGSSTETVYIEENVTDVNSDITIEPPQ